MASDTMPILNLSPIPELSEMELSTVLEQLSAMSDVNGEATDRNVEDILREAEELIDMTSMKADSVDSKTSLKYDDSSNPSHNGSISSINRLLNSDSIKYDDSTSVNDILNLSVTSEETSNKNTKSESIKSGKNETDNTSQSEQVSSRSSRSLTNHIQSTLDSLKECSKKIEKQAKNSPQRTLRTSRSVSDVRSEKSSIASNENEKASTISKLSCLKSRESRGHCYGEDSEKCGFECNSTILPLAACVANSDKTGQTQTNVRKKTVPKAAKQLNFGESMKVLDCFERLYRGKPVASKTDDKRPAQVKKLTSRQIEFAKPVNSKSANNLSKKFGSETSLHVKKAKPYASKEFDSRCSIMSENRFRMNDINQEDISFEKCLELLNEDNPSGTGMDAAPFDYAEFAEKMLKQCKATVSVLQGEIEDLRCELKRNRGNESLPNWDSNMTQKFWSQENVIQTLREENSKLFKEIEEIKGQLRMSGARRDMADTGDGMRRSEMQGVEATDPSGSNGIARLEEELASLKQKYEEQLAKLEDENRRLRRESVRDERPRETSPVKHAFAQTERESCSVGVQWRSEEEEEEEEEAVAVAEGETCPRRDPSRREFQGLENKENVEEGARRRRTRARVHAPAARPQRKMSEHENQLMVSLRALHSEVTAKERESKRLRNELEVARSQVKRLSGGAARARGDVAPRRTPSHAGTQTIGLAPKIHDAYDPARFQVSAELENENEELRARTRDLEMLASQLKDKRIRDLQILQKLHEEEIDKLASRLNTQTALTNHLHSLLVGR